MTLTVTDDDGATDTGQQTVTVTAPPANMPPTAAFTATADGLTAAFDGTGLLGRRRHDRRLRLGLR